MTTVLRPRAGAALLISLLVLLVLDCVVLGTMHLALLERRVADNAASVLRLRLAAESGARQGLAAWDATVDSLEQADPPRRLLDHATDDRLQVTVFARRVSREAWLLRAEAQQPAPGPGRAAAALLVRPPALPPALEPATAALTAAGPVTLMDGAVIRAPAGDECADGLTFAARLESAPRADGSARIEGGVSAITADTDIAGSSDRIFALAASVHNGDLRLDQDRSGALLVRGSLTIAAGVVVRGFVLVGGDLITESGASIVGAAHVGGSAAVGGGIVLDACIVEQALTAAALRSPAAFGRRPWLPAF